MKLRFRSLKIGSICCLLGVNCIVGFQPNKPTTSYSWREQLEISATRGCPGINAGFLGALHT